MLELGRLHDVDPAAHGRMVRPAILGAEQVIAADLRRLEPHRGIAARQHVLLHPERRDVEAVDHVLRGHRQLDRPAQRDVQLVDLGPPLGMLRVPHPLLADHVDLERVNGRVVHAVEEDRPPDEHDQPQQQRHADPDDSPACCSRSAGSSGPPSTRAVSRRRRLTIRTQISAVKNAGDARTRRRRAHRRATPWSTPDRETAGNSTWCCAYPLAQRWPMPGDPTNHPDRGSHLLWAPSPRRSTPLAPEHHEHETPQRDRGRRPQDADQPQDRQRVLAGGRVVVVAEQEQPADRRADPALSRPLELGLKFLGRKIDAVEVAGDPAVGRHDDDARRRGR